jgi:integrase
MAEEIFYGRPNTIKCQKSLFKNWIEPYLPIDNSGLDTGYLVKMVRVWEERGLKPGTIRLLMAILKKLIYLRTGSEVRAPRLSRTLQNANQEPVKAWTHEEVEKGLQMAQRSNPLLYDLLVIGLFTGARPGEIFGLRGKDINFLTRKINIVNTKTGKPRTVRMPTEVEQTLRKYIKPGEEDNFLFKGKVPNKALRYLCKCAKIREITFHGLRHTHATLALEAGKSARDVARQLGHAKVSTTLDVYWAAINDDMEVDFL